MAVREFLCLSQCKHKLLSRGSTFSKLADEVGYVPGRILLKLEDAFENYRFTTKVRIILQNIICTYKIKTIERTIKIPPCLVEKQKVYEIQRTGKYNQLKYLPDYEYFCYEVENKKYDLALDIAYSNYVFWKNRRDFREKLIKILCATENVEEAVVESVSCLGVKEIAELEYRKDSYRNIEGILFRKLKSETCFHFIIVPFCKSHASSRFTELMLLGMVFFHLGHRVSLILEPVDDVEESYMREHRELTTKRNVSVGCEQYIWSDIMEQGIESFLMKIKMEGEKVIIISRRREFVIPNMAPVIFPDYSFVEDEERLFGMADFNLEAYMLEKSDYICSYDLKGKENIIALSEREHFRAPGIIEGSWGLDRQNRLSVRHIFMAAEILNKMQQMGH